MSRSPDSFTKGFDIDATSLLSKIESPRAIRELLDLHLHSRAPVHLIVAGRDEPVLAKIAALRPNHVDLECTLAPGGCHGPWAAYSLIGELRNGSSFLACGEIDPTAEQPSGFKLKFPTSLDVSQSRESFRCQAPSGYFVHLSAPEPHLNDIVCKLHDISLDGLAFEWPGTCDDARHLLSASSDYAILMARSDEIHLGKLRIVHMTPMDDQTVVGCAIVTNARLSLDAVVMNVQRCMRTLS